jgi:peptide-methionine (R)-S-oxide reductase
MSRYFVKFHALNQIKHLQQLLQSSPTHFHIRLISVTDLRKRMTSTLKVQKSDQEWQAILSPEQFRILRKAGTEPAGSGKFNHVRASIPIPVMGN